MAKKYDPKKPVTIHNPYPAHKWPFKKGERVYYIEHQGREPEIRSGVVKWYQPALEGSYVVTEGRPCYLITPVGGGNSPVVAAADVRRHTVTGRRELVEKIVQYWTSSAAWATKQSVDYMNKAGQWRKLLAKARR